MQKRKDKKIPPHFIHGIETKANDVNGVNAFYFTLLRFHLIKTKVHSVSTILLAGNGIYSYVN